MNNTCSRHAISLIELSIILAFTIKLILQAVEENSGLLVSCFVILESTLSLLKNYYCHTFENRSSPEKFATGLGAEELTAKEEDVLLVMACVGFPLSIGSELFQPPKSSSCVIIGDDDFPAPNLP